MFSLLSRAWSRDQELRLALNKCIIYEKLLTTHFPCPFVCPCSSALPTGLQSSSTLRSLRQARVRWPASTVCSKACQGPFASWSTSCSRNSLSSLFSASSCERTPGLLLFTDLNHSFPLRSLKELDWWKPGLMAATETGAEGWMVFVWCLAKENKKITNQLQYLFSWGC